ncbi:MAG: hypothetical protein Q4G10_08080 [Bacteroidia bacterium]|nr:hypothetical protein [Bacteroidia bacterium]
MGISGDGNIHWYAANIRNGQWKKTGRRLEELGVQFYIPLSFNTLLFVRTTKPMALSLVNSGEIGAHYLIDRNTRTIMTVPDKQMEDFIKVIDLSPDAECLTQVPIRKGSRVRVVKGSLSGVEGEVLEMPDGLFLIVSVCSLLCAKVEIPKSYVVAI